MKEPIIPIGHEPLKVRYKEGSPQITQEEYGGCIDLYNYEGVELKAGEFKLIDLGIAMQLPPGFDAILIPRSSTFKKYGLLLVNSPGYIDHTYCGSEDWWFAPAYATRDVSIPAGTRCFQFRLIKQQPQLYIQSVDSLGEINRGGCGSTGD